MIEAIETLESTFKPEKIDKKEENINYNKWTVAQLKDFCSKNNIRVLSSFKKADIIYLVKEFNKSDNL